jgi:membrane associated rhomboid family serine protease
MKITGGTISLASALLIVFGIELATHSVADDASLLKLGGLPDDGELNGQFWRFATYSFLHFNWTHLLVNLALLLWIGRIVERRAGIAQAGAIYFSGVIFSAAIILLVHIWHPKAGTTVGASGGIFGLLGAALVISYRQSGNERLIRWLWIALLVGFGVSFLPDISMAGHIGGILGGLPVALLVKPRTNEN